MRHTLGYINIFEYLHPQGTFLCRNFCNTLKKFMKKKIKFYAFWVQILRQPI